MSTQWDRWLLGLAQYAATASKDPSTKVGAVAVGRGDRRKISLGYNGFPPGIADDGRLDDRKVKYSLMVHAEENALANATFDLTGGTLYSTSHPCVRCARVLLAHRIARVVCPPLPPVEPGRWTEELPQSSAMLREAGVEVVVLA